MSTKGDVFWQGLKQLNIALARKSGELDASSGKPRRKFILTKSSRENYDETYN